MKLSVAVPVFNEEARILDTLPIFANFLEHHFSDFEIVFYDDGSTDRTVTMLQEWCRAHSYGRMVQGMHNRGRGFGMKSAILAARGDYILETDIDFPVPGEHLIHFLEVLETHSNIAFIAGSRAHRQSRFIAAQPVLRVIAGWGFHILFRLLFGVPSWDLMCGFKLFRRENARKIFARVVDERYLAAAEIFLAARAQGMQWLELPVAWRDDTRSKVRIVRDTVRTLRGLYAVFIREQQGVYGTLTD